MSVDQNVLKALRGFGIEEDLAVEAAKRYSGVDAAVDWCFGPGEQWKASQNEPHPPQQPLRPHVWDPQNNIQHHEISPAYDLPTAMECDEIVTHSTEADAAGPVSASAGPTVTFSEDHKTGSSAGPPPLPSRPLGSNNPFRRPLPEPSPAITVNIDGVGEDEDEDLRRALELSMMPADAEQEGTTEADGIGGTEADLIQDPIRRDERERSLRATAPPPSPDPTDVQMGSLFGPSNRDEQGDTQMVCSNTLTVTLPLKTSTFSPNTEDVDLNRAIEASMQSSGQLTRPPVEPPAPKERAPGAPMVLASVTGARTIPAHALQALIAAPQIRDVIKQSSTEHLNDVLVALRSLTNLFDDGKEDYYDVDIMTKVLMEGKTPATPAPSDQGGTLISSVADRLIELLEQQPDAVKSATHSGRYWQKPNSLFRTALEDWNGQQKLELLVNFHRTPETPPRIHDHLVEALWGDDQSQNITELSEVLVVTLQTQFWPIGVPRRHWKLEETLILDRYMKENSGWSAQIRGQQGVAQGNVRRIEKEIEELATHRGQDMPAALKSLIRFYETTAPPEDNVQAEVQADIMAKLKSISSGIETKVASLKEDLERESKIAHGSLFETDDPERSRHVYKLRAVCIHAGSTPNAQLHMYAAQADGTWWRIQDHETTTVTWDTVANDETGRYLDAGPYLLVYSRDTTRNREDMSGRAKAPESQPQGDVEMGDESTSGEQAAPPDKPASDPPTGDPDTLSRPSSTADAGEGITPPKETPVKQHADALIAL